MAAGKGRMWRGKELGKLNELIRAAGPFWQALSESEKRLWKERARHFKRSDNYSAGKKRRLRSVAARPGRPDAQPRKPHESDLAASDAVEPMELPGPILPPRPPPPRPLVPPLSLMARPPLPPKKPKPPEQQRKTARSWSRPPLNADAAPSVAVMEAVSGAGLFRALLGLGLAGPSGRLLPSARLHRPAPVHLLQARPPTPLSSSSGDEMSSVCPRPPCRCPPLRPAQSRHRRPRPSDRRRLPVLRPDYDADDEID